jgi:quinol monooxygenase YgiN
MMIEYTRYTIPENQRSAFVQAYERAQAVLQGSPHCLRYELSQCVEDQASFILRIEWDSIDGHLQGFRKSPEFKTFFEEVRPFFNDIAEMRHYEATSVQGQK